MKKKPVVAVVGRPNVGKSTLFNVLAGDMISIVKDTPGVTRDRIYADCTWLDHSFTLIDTGGIEPDTKDIILSQMREQAEIAPATGCTPRRSGETGSSTWWTPAASSRAPTTRSWPLCGSRRRSPFPPQM